MAIKYDAILNKLREKDGGADYGPAVSRYSGHYIGEIIAWPTATPPAHCLICDGSLVSRTAYAALFAVIGTTYGEGEGDGSTAFALPDLRGRFVEGVPAGGAVGTAIEAGLPEIAGTAAPVTASGTAYAGIGLAAATGAMSAANAASARWSTPSQGDGMSLAHGIDFSAARSNSIYGNAQTVQPPALTQLYVIVAE